MGNVQYSAIKNHDALKHVQDYHMNKHEYFYIS
jgi:hypothetical protein